MKAFILIVIIISNYLSASVTSTTTHAYYYNGYPKFYWVKSQWNGSDWIAWAGGKGWYSTYDEGDAYPDVFWKTKAHHEQFEYLIKEFQNSRTKYNFRISDGLDWKYQLADEYK